jgi:alpha-mannosidase
MLLTYYKLIILFIFCPIAFWAQPKNAISGFDKKIFGDEINYFSPMHQFAPVALLTRANGKMPIAFSSPIYKGKTAMATYEFLMGHSNGTSKANRKFDIFLNNELLYTINTPYHTMGNYQIIEQDAQNGGYAFYKELFDANADAFGKLFIMVPSKKVLKQANFKIVGRDEASNDWLMIFMYKRSFNVIANASNLITKTESKRQLNLFVENPNTKNTLLTIQSKHGTQKVEVRPGYNALHLPFYDLAILGLDTLKLFLNQKNSITKTVHLNPIGKYSFHLIHHSHNDIGYSHLQSEVEAIQNNNISTAIRWMKNTANNSQKAVWHIESLWAVENFLRTATKETENDFVEAIKKGNIVLSSNYANVLTGLCKQEELNWLLEYAKHLEHKYGIKIKNAMQTDIPGISYSGLLAYVNNQIPYLSFGPNYMESFHDHGDRVGGVVKEQGDQIFYWKPNDTSNRKLLVWTAGKGYSYFHGVADDVKYEKWEQKITKYIDELVAKKYPYEMVKIRYTKRSDNGPVDSTLNEFVQSWNEKYLSPKLYISNLDELCHSFEKKYGDQIPVRTGEITPYWEDGAYSTAIEEMETRQLVKKTLALEEFAKQKNLLEANKAAFYAIHRHCILFHEHTWGAWCSVSDPENVFTTEQWHIKKSFLDSAVVAYNALSKNLNYTYIPPSLQLENPIAITDFTLNKNGGIASLLVNGKEMVQQQATYKLFEGVYSANINTTKHVPIEKPIIKLIADNLDKKIVEVKGSFPSIANYVCTYTLLKKEKKLQAHFEFDKLKEPQKEGFHIAMPFAMDQPQLLYGNANQQLEIKKAQLPGSNKDFICTEDYIWLKDKDVKLHIYSPSANLFEVGDLIDENQVNGSKVWKSELGNLSNLYLYVLNNYWHTNYKAYQTGHFNFDVEIGFEKNK